MRNSKTMSIREAALALDVSLQQVYKLVWEGRLLSLKVDGKWRVPQTAVQARLALKAGAK